MVPGAAAFIGKGSFLITDSTGGMFPESYEFGTDALTWSSDCELRRLQKRCHRRRLEQHFSLWLCYLRPRPSRHFDRQQWQSQQ